MTASLKSEETSQDENVSQGNQIVQKRFLLFDKKRKEMHCNHNNFFFYPNQS